MAESTRQREAFDSYWQLGAERSIETPVTGLATSGGRVTGVETDRGLIESPAVVVASGLWCNRLAVTVGESLPVAPIRVQIEGLQQPVPVLPHHAKLALLGCGRVPLECLCSPGGRSRF